MQEKSLIVAITIVLVIVICVGVYRKSRCQPCARSNFTPRDGPPGDLIMNPIDALSMGGNERAMGRALNPRKLPAPLQRQSVYETMNRFYSTADVDPLIVGQGYEFRDNTRDVYAGRTGDGGQWGLQEFTVDNQPGDVGVDIGPNALSEYEGSILGYNDGIPEQWAFPSTPIRWYRPRRADNYGHDGPSIVDEDKLYPLYVPDHEPYIGEDTEPELDD